MNKMSSQELSVAIATFNEEKNIKDCLESVKDFADEIVIVDGESKDRTVEIAKKYTDKIIITENKPMFHINKNLAIDNCSNDWILQLDADERVSTELRDEILRVINSNPDQNGFWIGRKNYFLGKFLTKGGQYPDPVIRLFKKGKGKLPEKSVHEQIEINGEVGWLKNDLIHIAYPSFFSYLHRSNRYTTHDAKKMLKSEIKVAKPEFLQYFLIKPLVTFFSIYFRHKGFMDGFAGFVFAAFSALHYTTTYIKYKEAKKHPEALLEWS
jgi:glycosyltransferase involved in cell wall biosynthesis